MIFQLIASSNLTIESAAEAANTQLIAALLIVFLIALIKYSSKESEANIKKLR